MMRFHATPLAGLTVIETDTVEDERGRFARLFCERELALLHPGAGIAQVNLSTTVARGTVRGLHFQHPPAAEVKIVRCLKGRVFDVAVDLRAGSPTFLRWHAVELDADLPRQVLIPQGFAHGFQALGDDVQLLYLHSAPWDPAHEGRLRYDDPALSIDWPLPACRVSPKDLGAAPIGADFRGIQP